jgi:hypothetical protein
LTLAIDLTCPTCGAIRGRSCLNPSGTPRKGAKPHATREAAARRADRPQRHRWVHPRDHLYLCLRCGTGKVNAQDAEGRWGVTWHRPDGTPQHGGPTPECAVGANTKRYLAKYGLVPEESVT